MRLQESGNQLDRRSFMHVGTLVGTGLLVPATLAAEQRRASRRWSNAWRRSRSHSEFATSRNSRRMVSAKTVAAPNIGPSHDPMA